MCVSPILRDNPNRGAKPLPGHKTWHDITSEKIYVPCGKCSECIANRQMQFIQRIQMESLNNWLYFATITYDNAHLPKVRTTTGYEFSYAKWKDLQDTIKRIRANNPIDNRELRYIAVSERGSKRGRPHFHIIFLVKKEKTDTTETATRFERNLYKSLFNHWAVNRGTRKNPIYEQNFKYIGYWQGKTHRANFDLHMIRPWQTSDGTLDVAFYVMKYMMKKDEREEKRFQALKINLDNEEFKKVWLLLKSRHTESRGLGLNKDKDGNIDPDIKNYINECIERSIRNGAKKPNYYNKENGKTFPMAKFYIEKFLTADQMDKFCENDEEYNKYGVKYIDTKKTVKHTEEESNLNRKREKALRIDVIDEIYKTERENEEYTKTEKDVYNNHIEDFKGWFEDTNNEFNFTEQGELFPNNLENEKIDYFCKNKFT